ncbi:RNA polymerase-binding protein RbpA [Agilicoccus flavus]|uniref:RNA polymerase-binding protein RbpA n=1 Tax=Agilicoccus flavus TaxID=2775968 RepID=UPI001CF6F292|nr:RNA polymerase-binding protein RbpA [Agilicoccus flavus]
MAGSHLIRGSRVGAGPLGEAERGTTAPRVVVAYWCERGHRTAVAFADEQGVEHPPVWDCTRCGLPAGPDRDAPPEAARTEPYKTHFAYVQERRSPAEGEQLLGEALAALRARRGG